MVDRSKGLSDYEIPYYSVWSDNLTLKFTVYISLIVIFTVLTDYIGYKLYKNDKSKSKVMKREK
jgi:hypothetical protein